MDQQRSHVPKFGNWDGENVPYTACFENARKEKLGNGIMINPNDPQENPEVFNMVAAAAPPSGKSSVTKKNRFLKRNTWDQLKSGTYRSTSSTSGSDKTTSHDSSVSSILKPKHQRRRSDRSQLPPLSPAHDYPCRSVAVPKFGEWDEDNARSAEGFTVIFNKVKEDKQIAAAKVPSVSVQQDMNKYHHQSSHKQDTQGKTCCGLF